MKPTLVMLDFLTSLKIETVDSKVLLTIKSAGVTLASKAIDAQTADDLAIVLVQYATLAKAAA